MAVTINVQASQTALAQSIAQGVAAFNARMAGQNQLNLQINAQSFTQPLGRISGDLKQFQSALAASNARVLAFGASTAVIGGVAKSFKDLATSTIEVEKALVDINRVLALSSSGLQKFSSDLFGVAKATASSFQDASEAALEFSRQGLSTEQTLQRVADALTLVRLTGVSAKQAVEDLTAVTNAYAQSTLDTTTILNKIVAVEQAFAVSAADLTSAVSRTGQAAQEAGVSFDQLNALVTSAQEKTARGGAVIGNALKTIFTRLQRTETLDQLENFNIAVRDIEGNVLPAVKILQNLASTYNTLADTTRSSLAEQVAGVYQVNILKSIIADLNDQQGDYNRALEIGAKATNEAQQANAALNVTLAALISQTGTNLQQLSSNIGKVTFEPVFKSLISPFNDAVTYINDLLEGEGLGSEFANGLLKGVKNILGGPALFGAVAIITKVIGNTFKDITTAVPTLLGITTQSQRRKDVEESILKILQGQSQASLALKGQAGNLTAQQQTLLNLARYQTAEYTNQLNLAKQLAATLVGKNVQVGAAGLQVGRITARGHIPTYGNGYVPDNARRAEIAGAISGGYQPGTVVPSPVGGVMNTAETVKYVPGFAQPFINPPEYSRAGMAHKSAAIRETGVNPYRASGYIPNFGIGGFKAWLRGKPGGEGFLAQSDLSDINWYRQNPQLVAQLQTYLSQYEAETKDKYSPAILNNFLKQTERGYTGSAISAQAGQSTFTAEKQFKAVPEIPSVKPQIKAASVVARFKSSKSFEAAYPDLLNIVNDPNISQKERDKAQDVLKQSFGKAYEDFALKELKKMGFGGAVTAESIGLYGSGYGQTAVDAVDFGTKTFFEFKGGEVENKNINEKFDRVRTDPGNFDVLTKKVWKNVLVSNEYNQGAKSGNKVIYINPVDQVDPQLYLKEGLGTATKSFGPQAIKDVRGEIIKEAKRVTQFNLAGGFIPNFANQINIGPRTAKRLGQFALNKADAQDTFQANIIPEYLNKTVEQYRAQALAELDKIYISTTKRKKGEPAYDQAALNRFKNKYKSQANKAYLDRVITNIQNIGTYGTKSSGFDTALFQLQGMLGEVDARKQTGGKFLEGFQFFDLLDSQGGLVEVRTRKKVKANDIFIKGVNDKLKNNNYKNNEFDDVPLGNLKVLLPKESPIYSGGFVPNFAKNWVYDSDVFAGGYAGKFENLKKFILDNPKLIKDILIAPAGAGKTTYAQKKGYTTITDFSQLSDGDRVLLLSGSNLTKKGGISSYLSDQIKAVNQTGGNKWFGEVSDETIQARRLQRETTTGVTRGKGAPLREPGLEKILMDLGFTGMSLASSGFIPNFANKNVMPIWMHPDAGIFQDAEAADHNELKEIFKGKIPRDSLRGYVQGNSVTLDAPLNFLYRNDKNIKQKIEKINALIKSKFGASTKLQSQGDSDPLYKALALQLNDFTKESAWKVVEGLNASDFSAFMQSATHIRGKDPELDAGLEEILKEKTLQQKQLMTKYGQGFGRYSGFIPNFASENAIKAMQEIVARAAGSNDPRLINEANVAKEKLKTLTGKETAFDFLDISTIDAPELDFKSNLGQIKIAYTDKKNNMRNRVVRLGLLNQLISDLRKGGHKEVSILGANLPGIREQLTALKIKDKPEYEVSGGYQYFPLSQGFVPNFAGYKDSVMQLEENISGNNAILDTTTGPYPFIRNSAQPNFAAAVADHGGEKKALQDSMSNQMTAGLLRKARGFIPGFAAGTPPVVTGAGAAGTPNLQQLQDDYAINLQRINEVFKELRNNLSLSNKEIATLSSEAKQLAQEMDVQEKDLKANNLGSQIPKNRPDAAAIGQAGSRTGFQRFAGRVGNLGNNLLFTIAAPLIAGQLQQLIERGKDRSEQSYGQRFASQAIGSGLSNISTGVYLGAQLAPLLGPLAPFGPLIGAAGAAAISLTSAALGASDSLEDLKKKSDEYTKQTQDTVGAGKGIIDTFKSLENLDPNSLEFFDANQKLQEYFSKIAETDLDKKFKTAGSDIDLMSKAIKEYEMERATEAKRLKEDVTRRGRKGLSVEDLGKQGILRTEDIIKKETLREFVLTDQARRLYGANATEGQVPASLQKFQTVTKNVVVGKQIAETGAAGEENRQKILQQNEQLFVDLQKVQTDLGDNFGEFVKEFKSQFSNLIFSEGKISSILKKYDVKGIDADKFSIQLQEIATENADYGKFIVNNFDKILEGIKSGKNKTLRQVVEENRKKIQEAQDNIRNILFRNAQDIASGLNNIAIELEKYEFEKSIGKLNLEKSASIINSAMSAIGKNITDGFKNQFELLTAETQFRQGKLQLGFEASQFEKGLDLQLQQQRLQQQEKLIPVLRETLNENQQQNLQTFIDEFKRTGTIKGALALGAGELKGGVGAQQKLQDFARSVEEENKLFQTRQDNTRKTFQSDQAFANLTLELNKKIAQEEYKLNEARYQYALKEKALIDSIQLSAQKAQIDTQAAIELLKLPAQSPNFMLGRGEFARQDVNRAIEQQVFKEQIAGQAKQAIADAQIADIQRQVLENNTLATENNTSAIEALIDSLTMEAAKGFEIQKTEIDKIDSKIKENELLLKSNTELGPEVSERYSNELEKLKRERAAITGSESYARNEAAFSIRQQQTERKAAQEIFAQQRGLGLKEILGGQNLNEIQDPVQFLKEKTDAEKERLSVLQEQKSILEAQNASGQFGSDVTLQNQQKIKDLDKQIETQRANVNKLDAINYDIQTKITVEKARQKQLDEDRAKRGKFKTGVQSAFDEIQSQSEMFEQNFGKNATLAFRDGLVGAIDAAMNRTDDLGSALMDVASGFLRTIQSAFNQQIANNLMLGIGSAMPGFTGARLGAQRGGIIRAQDGIYVPSAAGGNGMAISDFGRTGDVNPALLEDGEYVLNRNAVDAMGGPSILDEINFGRFPRFANGGQNSGSLSAGMNMGEPFAQLSEFGKEQSPEYRAYVDRLREQYQKDQEKKAKRKAFINQLIMTGVSAGVTFGLGSISKMALSGVNKAGISSTQISQARNAGVTINESGIPNMHTGGLMRFASGGYLPYGNRLNDTIPALLSGGEYIVNSRAVRRYGVGGMNRINAGIARFEDGGLVGTTTGTQTPGNVESSSSNNVSINITVNATAGETASEEQTSTNNQDDQNANLGRRIKQAVLQVIVEEQRSGGLLDSTKKR